MNTTPEIARDGSGEDSSVSGEGSDSRGVASDDAEVVDDFEPGDKTEHLATAVTPEMKRCVDELAHHKRQTQSELLREVVAEACGEAPEINTIRDTAEHVRLVERDPP